LWALKDAPVADSLERLILVVLGEHAGGADGCTAFPSRDTIASLALADPKTVQRVIQRLVKRKLIAPGDQSAAQYIRADRRPVVYDLMIPYSWFPNPERMNEERQGRGLPPLTPADRPDIVAAAAKARRKDAGVPRPKAARGDSQSPRSKPDHEGTSSPGRGDSESRTGGLEDPRTSSFDPPIFEPPTSLSVPARRPEPDPVHEREIAASTDQPSTAQRVVRAAGVVTADEEEAFIAWTTAKHQPRSSAWWRTVAGNGDLPDLAADWRTQGGLDATQPLTGTDATVAGWLSLAGQLGGRQPHQPYRDDPWHHIRQQAAAGEQPDGWERVPFCGHLDCDEITRMRQVDTGDGIKSLTYCSACHPALQF
jgi:hypothetical protein